MTEKVRRFVVPALELVVAALFATLLAVAFNHALAADYEDCQLDLPVAPLPPKAAPVGPKYVPGPQAPPVAPVPPSPVQPPPPSPPPPTIYGHDLRSENSTVVYVLDCSGSMTADVGQYTDPDGKTAQGDRLARAKGALISSIRSLPESWEFDIVTYQCDVTMWRTQIVKALPSAKAAAESWLTQWVYAGGATGTGPAVTVCFNTWPDDKLVVLLTDGAPNCGAGDDMGGPSCIAAHRVMINGNNKARATINVFGIGATGDFKAFCQDVACDSGGTYTDVR